MIWVAILIAGGVIALGLLALAQAVDGLTMAVRAVADATGNRDVA